MTFDKWIDTFIEEKGIDLEQVLEVEGKEWGTNYIPVEVVVDAMKHTTKREQDAIKDMIVRIDFRNGDVLHYFKHLAGAIAL